ncbi:MAG: MATE family efflux transporter, partial [Candidatus Asgardarchaeum sp.]
MREKNNTNLTLGKVVVGGFWLYLDTILVNLIGYVYWLIIGRISGPDVVGYASATLSITWIVQTMVLFGIPVGVQRFLGRAFGFGDHGSLKRYFLTSLTFLLFVVVVAAIILWYFNNILSSLIKIDAIYIILAGFLILFMGISLLFKSFLISTLRIDKIFIFDVVANMVRLIGGVYLVILGYRGVGAVLGYVFSGFVSLILFSLYTFKLIHGIKSESPIVSFSILKEILGASYVSWLPTLITTVGIQLGVLVIFGSHGAMETGIYFLAFAIFNVLLALPNMFLGILFPVLSGLESGHAQPTQRAMNLVLAAATPLSVAMAIYSEFLLGLVGSAYTVGWFVLTVLAISVPFMCIVNGVNSLVYALGNYRAVLVIGSAMSFM